jgi:hypothetical protein
VISLFVVDGNPLSVLAVVNPATEEREQLIVALSVHVVALNAELGVNRNLVFHNLNC